MVRIPTRIPTPSQLCHQDPSSEETPSHLRPNTYRSHCSTESGCRSHENSRTTHATYKFESGDLVWLEGTNVHTTHPKAKLAPRRHGPFKVISTWGVNCRLQLPKSWKCFHPVFHNSLISQIGRAHV